MEESPAKSTLSQKERKQLRGRAQQIKASVIVGKSGLSDTVIAEIRAAFRREPLVKVRLSGDRAQKTEEIQAIESTLFCECVSKVGFTAAFFRESKSEDSAPEPSA